MPLLSSSPPPHSLCLPVFLLLLPLLSLTMEKMRNLSSKNNSNFLRLVMVVFFSSITMHTSDSNIPSSLRKLNLNGSFSFHDVYHAAKDFGNRYQFLPSAILYPKSVSDISTTIKHIFEMGDRSKLTVAARGHGHSLQGQAQAPSGIVMMMESLQELETRVHTGEVPYVDVSGGALWINVLQETLKHGLAPRSWTDYLHLTVGGTLSNAGVSGQAFRHGPQISNVHQLEIVTGKGEVVNCSAEQNADLFFSVLGGLGQFGIITRARIALEPAPKMVRWIRVLYSDFSTFAEDQEMLISAENSFDYIEGFVIKNRTGLLNNWRSFLNSQDPVKASQFKSEGKTLFCLEMTKNLYSDESNQEIITLLSKLRYTPSTLFQSEVSYVEFLDRVHISELKLKSEGMWDVAHPWLNLLIPRTRVHEFAEEVFGNILTDSSNGPIIIYPVNKSKWDNRTSAVVPEEEIFYMVAFLSSVPSSSDHDSLERALKQNEDILEFCEKAGIPMKQYLPHYTTQKEWKAHFGNKWEVFVQRKSAYDPLAILAPGQRIFQKPIPIPRHLST